MVKRYRGYGGWHETWNGENVYLRSRLEYLVALMLDELYIEYKVEENIYGRYKPDFFIYKNGKLNTIIEVKYSKSDTMKYITKYYEYFKDIGVRYLTLHKSHITKICKKFGFEDKELKWVNESKAHGNDFSGSENGHYGFKHTEESKRLIGLKTAERNKDPKYMDKFKQSIKKSMTPDICKMISERQKKVWSDPLKRERMSIKMMKYDKRSMIFECIECGESFEVEEWCLDGKLIKYMRDGNIASVKFCGSRSCPTKYNKRQLREEKRANQIEMFNRYINEIGEVPTRKVFKEYCEMFNMSGDIRTTFGTFTKFKEEVYIEYKKNKNKIN